MSLPAVSIEAVRERGITEVLHFTTSAGLLGILAKQEVLARTHLSRDEYLEHIYRPNSSTRYEDPKYWRYVNLSITSVNDRFFGISQRWHPTRDNLFWTILHFDPIILTHPGVLYAPGNMGYRGMEPHAGSPGFDAIFAGRVPSGHGNTTLRSAGRAANLPTDPQAEVLYPDRLSTEFLLRVTVADDEHAASAEGIVGAVRHRDVPVVSNPAGFRP